MFRRIERTVSMFAEKVGTSLIVVMTLVVCYTVFTRYVLSFTPAWGEESALLCMVWFGFLSTALGVRDDGHIGVTIIDKFLPPAVVRWLDLFKWTLILLFGVFMVTQGMTLTRIGLNNCFPGIGLTSAWLYVIVPIAGGAIIVYCLEKLVDTLRALAGKGQPGEGGHGS